MALRVGVSPPQKATQRCVEEKRSSAELYVLERRQRSEERRGGQIAGKEPPSPLTVIPQRQQHVDEAQPGYRQKQQRSESDERTIQEADIAKGDGSQRPGMAVRSWPDRKPARLCQQEHPDDEVRQLVGDCAG